MKTKQLMMILTLQQDHIPIDYSVASDSSLSCSMFSKLKDNMGALRLAQIEPGRNIPCSKFYALKLHWCWSWLKPKAIEIVHCPTKDQKADFLTKPLGPTLFKACRLLSMGW